MGLIGFLQAGAVLAVLGGQGLHQRGQQQVGGAGEGDSPAPPGQLLQLAGDSHRPLGTEHRVTKGDGLQQRHGPVLAVWGQNLAGQLAQSFEDRAGLFKGGQPLQGAGKAKITGGQGCSGNGSRPEPLPQFIQRCQIHL